MASTLSLLNAIYDNILQLWCWYEEHTCVEKYWTTESN